MRSRGLGLPRLHGLGLGIDTVVYVGDIRHAGGQGTALPGYWQYVSSHCLGQSAWLLQGLGPTVWVERRCPRTYLVLDSLSSPSEIVPAAILERGRESLRNDGPKVVHNLLGTEP